MTAAIERADGGYCFIRGVLQYSAGVKALAGYCIERVRFSRPMTLDDGFDRIATLLREAGRPLTALCACELRSPAPFTEDEFRDFNRSYAAVLEQWGLLAGGNNPVARSNVCPERNPPTVPVFHAFCFARESTDVAPSFVIAGSGEVPEGQANYRDHIIRFGDISAVGMREKARFVHGEMERRMQAVGLDWSTVTATQVYTVHDIYPFIADELVGRGAAAHGLTWHFARPPIVGLDYEMDCRGLAIERVLQV